MKKAKKSSLSPVIITWNNMFQVDYFWRKKYNIPFNSPEHRRASQIDMYFDVLEDRMFDKVREKARKKEEIKSKEPSEAFKQAMNILKESPKK